MNNKIKRALVVVTLVGGFLALMITIALNRTVISDSLRGLFYHPSAEMESIRGELQLTGEGERVFNASFPELDEKNAFNQRCKSHDGNSYILGCYVDGGIFVYNITDERFEGIRESTLAHELLHAVYARMSDSEKISLSVLLEEVYRAHGKTLGDELAVYDGSKRYDELYARIGTEIKDLPEELEKHYAKVFKNQDNIVSFYDKYGTPLREVRETFERLEGELASLKAQIETKRTEYETKVAVHNQEVGEFNNCADRVGCFASDYALNTRRAELLKRQNELNELHAEISELVDTHNAKVDEYNDNIAKNEALTDVINSNAKIEKIEETGK